MDLPPRAPAQYAAMSWQHIRECEKRSMQYAPHTVTHPILARVSDADSRREIETFCNSLWQEAANPVC